MSAAPPALPWPQHPLRAGMMCVHRIRLRRRCDSVTAQTPGGRCLGLPPQPHAVPQTCEVAFYPPLSGGGTDSWMVAWGWGGRQHPQKGAGASGSAEPWTEAAAVVTEASRLGGQTRGKVADLGRGAVVSPTGTHGLASRLGGRGESHVESRACASLSRLQVLRPARAVSNELCEGPSSSKHGTCSI